MRSLTFSNIPKRLVAERDHDDEFAAGSEGGLSGVLSLVNAGL